MVLGATEPADESEVFSSVIDRVLARSESPTLIFRYPESGGQGPQTDGASPSVGRVLLSVESNRASRAAEEIAYSLAAHNDGLVLALHLIAEATDGPFHLDMTSGTQNHRAGPGVGGGIGGVRGTTRGEGERRCQAGRPAGG